MSVKIEMEMPKSCWQCKLGLNDFAKEETTCHLIFMLRYDVWNPPDPIKKGEKCEDCPLKEIK